MTKRDFIERLYVTEETESNLQVTFNDTANYVFVRLDGADRNKVNLVFNSSNPAWADVRSLMHDVRLYGEVVMEMRCPIRYPIAIL